MNPEELEKRIFAVPDADNSFENLALDIFRYQSAFCEPYARYISLLGIDPARVDSVDKIPFLPIETFRNHEVYSAPLPPRLVFSSSGTTGEHTSRHMVYKPGLYEESFMRGFEYFYGKASGYSIFALLPSYLEQEGSSLIYMVERLHAENPGSGGFYLYDHRKLAEGLQYAIENNERVLLVGVTFALVDFAEKHILDLHGAVIMETGGMKGRRNEIERKKLHSLLGERLGVAEIHSEYGMTELLSQAYSKGGGIFRCPQWMKVSVRDLQNPLRKIPFSTGIREESPKYEEGGLDIIDLANLYSCSFISTGDRGAVYAGGSFEVHGRIEGEILRGCNMLV